MKIEEFALDQIKLDFTEEIEILVEREKLHDLVIKSLQVKFDAYCDEIFDMLPGRYAGISICPSVSAANIKLYKCERCYNDYFLNHCSDLLHDRIDNKVKSRLYQIINCYDSFRMDRFVCFKKASKEN